MSRKKQRLSIFDIGRLPVTPVALPQGDAAPVGTLAEYNRREQAREKQEAATRQAEIERVQKDSSRLMAECLSVSAPLQSKFWSSSIENIKAHLHDDDVFDNLFLPTSDEAADSNVIYDAIQTFLDGEVFTLGYSLGDVARRRFGLYVASQVNAGVVVSPESLKVMFDRCFSLGIFKDDADSEFVEHFRVESPAKQPRVSQPVEQSRVTMDDLMNTDESTREGRRQAHSISESLYVEEMLPVATAWFASLQKNWNFTPSSEDMKKVSAWIDHNNLNRLSKSTYDFARRWMVASGYWPSSVLTAVEALNVEVEKMDLTRMGHDEKRVLNNRRQAARESDIARFGHAQ